MSLPVITAVADFASAVMVTGNGKLAVVENRADACAAT